MQNTNNIKLNKILYHKHFVIRYVKVCIVTCVKRSFKLLIQDSTGNRSACSIAHKVDIAAVRVAIATLVKVRIQQLF